MSKVTEHLIKGHGLDVIDDDYFTHDRPSCLIYASCHGRTLVPFLKENKEFRKMYSLARIETGPMQLGLNDGMDVLGDPEVQSLFSNADALLTYNMGDRHGQLALRKIMDILNPKCNIITFVAPNCSCFWPIAYGYEADMGVYNMLDHGAKEEDVWRAFRLGGFDPMFQIRWRTELGRLKDKESYHDIGIADFIVRNHKKVKLFMAASHPSYVMMAYIGNEIMNRLGFPVLPEDVIVGMNPEYEAIGGQPETHYEFQHYKFLYPMTHNSGWEDYYRDMIKVLAKHWETGALTLPARD